MKNDQLLGWWETGTKRKTLLQGLIARILAITML